MHPEVRVGGHHTDSTQFQKSASTIAAINRKLRDIDQQILCLESEKEALLPIPLASNEHDPFARLRDNDPTKYIPLVKDFQAKPGRLKRQMKTWAREVAATSEAHWESASQPNQD